MSRTDRTTSPRTASPRATNLLAIVVAAALGVLALSSSPASAQQLVIAQGTVMRAPDPSPYVRHESAPHHGSARVALIASGTGLLLGGWAGNMIAGSLAGWHQGHSCTFSISDSCRSTPDVFDPAWSDFRLASVIPLVGPFVQGGALPDSSNGWPVFLAIDELFQLGGLALLIAGIATPSDDDAAATETQVTVTPIATSTTVGMMVGGRFQ